MKKGANRETGQDNRQKSRRPWHTCTCGRPTPFSGNHTVSPTTTRSSEECHQATNVLQIRSKEKTKPRRADPFFIKVHAICFTSGWKVSPVRGPLNPTSKNNSSPVLSPTGRRKEPCMTVKSQRKEHQSHFIVTGCQRGRVKTPCSRS